MQARRAAATAAAFGPSTAYSRPHREEPNCDDAQTTPRESGLLRRCRKWPEGEGSPTPSCSRPISATAPKRGTCCF
jgi:hypothetical protein